MQSPVHELVGRVDLCARLNSRDLFFAQGIKFKKKLLALSGNNQSGSSIGIKDLRALQKIEGWKNLWHG